MAKSELLPCLYKVQQVHIEPIGSYVRSLKKVIMPLGNIFEGYLAMTGRTKKDN
jgi:hypothetical protein